jgi:hypothetical protein
VIAIENCLVVFPTELVALTVKLDVPVAVGVPVIVPLDERLKPAGNEPLEMLHVMGVVPLAESDALYDAPTRPLGRLVVVIVGAFPLGVVPPPPLLLKGIAVPLHVRVKMFPEITAVPVSPDLSVKVAL